MGIIVLFASFFIALAIGIPVAFSIGLSSTLYLLIMDIPLSAIAQKMYAGMDSFALLCIPGFILAGNIMNTGGVTKRIVAFSNALIGHITGGLSLANIVSSMIFAGITGTAIADTTSIGSVMIPAMKKQGYDSAFAVGVTASSSTIGPIIPPSLPMIIVGTLTGLSITKLFLGGAVPGLLLGLFLIVVAYGISRKNQYPRAAKKSAAYVLRCFINSFWALMMTVIILLGILGGFFTPTEASIVAACYALFVGLVIYKELSLRAIPSIVITSMKTTAAILFLVAFARVFAWILAREQIPQHIAQLLLSLSSNKYVILLLMNLLLLFVGMFMETIAALVILFPVLLPVAVSVGMSPIHFGVMAVLNLMIGLTTPPIGVCLLVGANIGKISAYAAFRGILPFICASLVVLLLVALFPQLTLFLPSLYSK